MSKATVTYDLHVDSGCLWIGDPAYSHDLADPEKWEEPLSGEPFGKGKGVLLPTLMGDGVYTLKITTNPTDKCITASVQL